MENNQAIGIVKNLGDSEHAQIEVLAYKENGEYIQDRNRIMESYPPFGFVFGPSFFLRNTVIGENEIVSFYTNESTHRDLREGDHKTVVDYSAKPQIKGYPIYTSDTDIVKPGKRIIDNERIQAFANRQDRNFYIRFENKLYGVFDIEKGCVIPNFGKEVQCWENFAKDELIEYDDYQVLLDKPQSASIQIDCMTSPQRIKWFLNEIKSLGSTFFNKLDKSSDWRKELRNELGKREVDSLDKIRFQHAIDYLQMQSVRREELLNITETSEVFKGIYQGFLKKLEGEFKIEIEKQHTSQLQKMAEECAELESEIEKATKRNKKLDEEAESINKEILYLEEYKDRIIADFKIHAQIQPSLPAGTNQQVSQTTLKNFVVEEYELSNDNLYDDKSFKNNFKFFLSEKKVTANNEARDILNALRDFKCILVSDIRIGVAFAEATQNCRFVIQQTEPDWLKFQNCWESGLGELWQSSHDNPEIIHLLLLEDVNLAAPECWARPLNDMNNGIRRKLPFSGTTWPDNFRIIAAPTQEEDAHERIGLPLIRHTFESWCGLNRGFEKNYNPSKSRTFIPGYLSPTKINIKSTHDPEEIELNYIKDYFDAE